jgi:hypothetical protein
MKVNFDNMRRQMLRHLNEITTLYNEKILNAPDEYRDYTEEHLEGLIGYVGALMCIYDDNAVHLSNLSNEKIVNLIKIDNEDQ